MVELIETPPRPDHRLLHGIIGIESRAQHAIAMTCESRPMSFEINRGHGFRSKL
jgi:hypothetical protein